MKYGGKVGGTNWLWDRLIFISSKARQMSHKQAILLATGAWATMNTLAATPVQAAEFLDYFHFSGAFHPAAAHFPIGLLVVAGVVELWGFLRGRKGPSDTGYTCLMLGAAGAVVAAILGWANADFAGEYNDPAKAAVLFQHRWLGVGVAVIGVLLAVIATRSRAATAEVSRGRRYFLLAGTLLCSALVGLTGSLGGKLVYGIDYYETVWNEIFGEKPGTPDTTDPTLVKTPPDIPTPDVPKTTGKVSFVKQVKPMFQATCYKCHAADKMKGDYRLDTKEFAFKNGESDEPPIIPGKADDSLLVKVIEGKGDYIDRMMPPKGDPLSTQQIATIRQWINEGAVWDE